MSSLDTAERLVGLVRVEVLGLISELSTLSAGSNTSGLPEVLLFHERLRDFVTRFGSMRRTKVAAHVMDGLRAGGSAQLEALASACAGLELFHAAALVHDDLIDSSDTRRNSPTFHIGWSTGSGPVMALKDKGNQLELGAVAGLLGGNALLILSARAIDQIPAAQRAPIARLFQEIQLRTIFGELQDSVLEANCAAADVAAIAEMAINKTAWYTVIAPMMFSAYCAGQGDELLGPIVDAGSSYGQGFQLLDDVTEVLGDPAVTGKSPLDDLRSGKATRLHHLVDSRCTAEEKVQLDQVYGCRDAGAAELEIYRTLVDRHWPAVNEELQDLFGAARARLYSAGFSERTVYDVENELNPQIQGIAPMLTKADRGYGG
ncbi:hypothetical protein BKG77_06625 [Mycobacteroides chelonae]|uniref:polyprenyl synthetase family protein n=2 Tax=Mycobacteroides chelonae TaxID=1774 RepID=UPI0008A8E847|nr:polyprenyl synthetase family protein [Mycobacteroides chelonae]OHU23342.1 hypothetical protein BKG77_06625 [Mycobacteroides chelonae]